VEGEAWVAGQPFWKTAVRTWQGFDSSAFRSWMTMPGWPGARLHLVDQAEQVIRTTPGVVDVSDVRLRWLGHSLLAEARVTVDSSLSLVDAHHLSHRVEHDLVHGVRRLTAATIHTEPLAPEAHPAHALVSHHD